MKKSHASLIADYATNFFGSQYADLQAPETAVSNIIDAAVIEPLDVPLGYVERFADVGHAQNSSIINDPELHFSLYGRQQGRAHLLRLPSTVSRVVIIAPSYRKQCGIGEYGRYLETELSKVVEEVRVVRTSGAALDLAEDFLNEAVVLVNHGPGLFDGLNPRLSQGESTTQLLHNLDLLANKRGAIPMILHHSLIGAEHHMIFSRQQQIMNSDIPSVAFISSAGRHFFMPMVELGISPVSVPDDKYIGKREEEQETIGFFGFFQYGGKDFDSLFHLVRELRGKLVGSVATSNNDELKRFNEALESLGLAHELGSGWIEDTELMSRLSEADYFYLPQNDYDHWNNSATARFVANLDRPLFLPPHHPFLDMADGSIFASKEDLPRIVAYIRESKFYERAVERVRKFRNRAKMANTAVAITREIPEKLSDVGKQLLASPALSSAERFEELDEASRGSFAEAHDVSPDTSLEDIIPHLPAFYRMPEKLQYWRKHYELGDLVHDTLLESIHTAYIAIAKRPITFKEIIRLLSQVTNADSNSSYPFGETIHEAILDAMGNKGGLFEDPEIAILENGSLASDWRTAVSAERIEKYSTEKTARKRRILDIVGPSSRNRRVVTNLIELMLLPQEMFSEIETSCDLSVQDLESVKSVHGLAQKMNRLIAQANKKEISLADHFVMDHLQVPQVEPKTIRYAVEEFIYYSGDKFILNAVRRIDKRDPFALEALVLSGMLMNLGVAAVLKHLLLRAEGRIEIINFDENKNYDAHADQLARFMDAARDPLFGLIDIRNDYEVLKRHNDRWWINQKGPREALYHDSGSNMAFLNMLYAQLSQTPSERADPTLKHDNPAWQMDASGHYVSIPELNSATALALPSGETLNIGTTLAGVFTSASIGFFEPEENGVWTRGSGGSVVVSIDAEKLAAATPEQKKLRLKMSFFGSNFFETPRKLSVSLVPKSKVLPAVFDDDEVMIALNMGLTREVSRDDAMELDIDLSKISDEDLHVLRIDIDRVTSPAAEGLSDDGRELGFMLHSLVFMPSTPIQEDMRADIDLEVEPDITEDLVPMDQNS